MHKFTKRMHNSYRNVQINSSMATYILAPSCTNICIYIFYIYKYALKVGAYCKYICMYIRNPITNCNTYVLVCMRNFFNKHICPKSGTRTGVPTIQV